MENYRAVVMFKGWMENYRAVAMFKRVEVIDKCSGKAKETNIRFGIKISLCWRLFTWESVMKSGLKL